MKVIAVNKSASFEYFIEEKYEAGIVLEGNEIKSLRDGAVNMNDSFCFVRGNSVSVKDQTRNAMEEVLLQEAYARKFPRQSSTRTHSPFSGRSGHLPTAPE